jgi:hypothetical protein
LQNVSNLIRRKQHNETLFSSIRICSYAVDRLSRFRLTYFFTSSVSLYTYGFLHKKSRVFPGLRLLTKVEGQQPQAPDRVLRNFVESFLRVLCFLSFQISLVLHEQAPMDHKAWQQNRQPDGEHF